MRLQLKVWTQAEALKTAFEASSASYPNESGGLLFGYRASRFEFVIEQISGPGPRAVHGPRSFIPDYDHDSKLALEIHERSTGEVGYLGDWHSHPNTTRSYLSRKDRSALRNILNSEDAKLTTVLSMVLSGIGDGNWSYQAWAAELVRRFIIFDTVAAVPVKLIIFD